MYKTAAFHSNLLVPWELVTDGYEGRPIKCLHFERPSPAVVERGYNPETPCDFSYQSSMMSAG